MRKRKCPGMKLIDEKSIYYIINNLIRERLFKKHSIVVRKKDTNLQFSIVEQFHSGCIVALWAELNLFILVIKKQISHQRRHIFLCVGLQSLNEKVLDL